MNIRKLPSGNYQIRYMENGKTYTRTLDHKPSQTEALELISKLKPVSVDKHTLETACKAYIASKNNLLSVSTIRGYEKLTKEISADIKDVPVAKITKPMLQTEINNFSLGRSPKTTANYGHFLLSVLSFYGNKIEGIIFPQKIKNEPYIPTEEEVKKILAEVKDTRYEVPIGLACYGLRRSEICALELSDLTGNVLTVNKALVEDPDGGFTIKTTKTTDSTRDVVISDYLADLIRKQGYVYNGFPGAIRNHLSKVQKRLGIQHFPLHKLRHFYASYLHFLGYTDKQIQKMGGWKTPGILLNTYTHAMDLQKAQKKAAEDIGSLMN